MSNISQKRLIQCVIFSGAICLMFLFLSLFIILSRKNWENGLRQSIFNIFPVEEYSVGKIIPVGEKEDEVACFEFFHDISNKNSGKKEFTNDLVLVLRITTYYGPLPAVFVYEGESVRFAGIAYLKSSIAKEFSEAKFDRQINYWTLQAEQIFKKARQQQGEK